MEDSGPARDGAGQRANNRGGGRGRGGNVGRNRGPKFEGSMTEVKGIFDLHGPSNMFMKTQKEISNHVGRTAKMFVGDLTRAVDELQMPNSTPPAPLDDKASKCDEEIWKNKYKTFHNREQVLTDFNAGLCSIALGQTSEALLSKVQSSVGYQAAMDARDGIAMMIIIRNVMSNIEEYRNTADTLCEALECFFAFKLWRDETLQQYHDRFISQNQVIDRVGGNVVLQGLTNVVAADPKHPTEAERALALERLKAVRFIRGTGGKYKTYLNDLKNAKLDGQDNYPITVSAAYNILQRREPDKVSSVIQENVTFATVAGDNGIVHEHINCHSCGQRGHFADHCPVTTTSEGVNGSGGAASERGTG